MDIALVAAMLGSAFVWLRRTRARWALAGFAILGASTLLARQLGLTLTSWVLQGSVVATVIVLVVVFQEDLRRLVELIAVRGLRRRARPPTPQATDSALPMVSSTKCTRGCSCPMQ